MRLVGLQGGAGRVPKDRKPLSLTGL